MLFPQQVSLFYAGKIADNFGAFMQLTYDGAADHFGIDNTDIRYAHHFSFGSDSDPNAHTLIVGITVNNNPTVQDAWNSTPAWGFPYAGSNTAPTPATSARIDSGGSGLGQNVAGAGVYAWFDSGLYAELTLYTAAIVGDAHLLDSTQAQVAHGVLPYWRVAYEKRWDRNSLEVGAYGIVAKQHPGNGMALQGVTDQYTDTAVDGQYQFIGEDHLFTVISTYIDEKWKLDASFANELAQNPNNTLKTFELVGEYYFQRKIGGALGYFDISGSTDALLYAPAPVGGSANGDPGSSGITAELNYLPWLNTKLELQYVHYDKFNGGSSNYDGAGRNASDNDTLYLLGWINF
ncbi:MAG: cytochrome C [Steroidobacteraceae bacterium]